MTLLRIKYRTCKALLDVRRKRGTARCRVEGMTEETVTVKMCRVPGVLRPDQLFFRPALVFQEMLSESACMQRPQLGLAWGEGGEVECGSLVPNNIAPGEHVADAGLEFSIHVSTGINRARFISDVCIDEGSGASCVVVYARNVNVYGKGSVGVIICCRACFA